MKTPAPLGGGNKISVLFWHFYPFILFTTRANLVAVDLHCHGAHAARRALRQPARRGALCQLNDSARCAAPRPYYEPFQALHNAPGSLVSYTPLAPRGLLSCTAATAQVLAVRSRLRSLCTPRRCAAPSLPPFAQYCTLTNVTINFLHILSTSQQNCCILRREV